MKQTKLHPKILQLRMQSKTIRHGALSVDEFGELRIESDLDKRIVKGYLIIWNKRSQMGRMWLKGSCAKSIQEHGPDSGSNYKIKFLYNHNPSDVLALFKVLKEDDTGLYFETHPLDDVDSANRVLAQLKSGSLNNFSPGWNIIWDKVEWDEATETIIFKEIDLLEGSIVGIPDELETFSIASANIEMEDAIDQTERFILSLPRKQRLEARYILNLQKSLLIEEPFQGIPKEHSEEKEPVKAGIDYNYLLNNFKLEI